MIVEIEMILGVEEIFLTHQGLEIEMIVENGPIEITVIKIMNARLVVRIPEKGKLLWNIIK